MNIKCLRLILVVCIFLITPARAGMRYDFARITSNATEDIASQLSLEVTDLGELDETGINQVSFTFYNDGPVASSITNIYIDDGILDELVSISGSGDIVNFVHDSLSPENFPGGENLVPAFVPTISLSAGINPNPPVNGVNPGESVTVVYSLLDNLTYDDVIEALNQGLQGFDSLRIGLHVQAIGDGADSDSFVLVPLPATIVLGLLGLGVGGLKLRRSL